MEPEDFDMKARKASENSVPAFDDEAWVKMELLLDKHLPQTKTKRRFFFWWFAALIPVALFTGYYLTNRPVNNTKAANLATAPNEKTTSAASIRQPYLNRKQPETNQPAEDASKGDSPDRPAETIEKKRVNLQGKKKPETAFTKPANILTSKGKESAAATSYVKPPLLNKSENKRSNSSFTAKEKEIKEDNKNKAESSSIQLPDNKENNRPASDKTISGLDNKESTARSTITDTPRATTENTTVKNSSNTSVKNKTPKNSFYVIIMSGLQASGTSFSSLGTAKPLFGAGVQYSSGALFLRTGVIVLQKIYTAKDKDYNRKSGTWMSIVTFDNIYADCNVIEVPLAIGYKISDNRKTGVYVAAGTSAFFMKKEDYQFYFKGQSGSDTTRHSTFTNNSRHYFSTINVSAGIEQKVTDRFSITAEPAIQIPTAGIGFGKVKLFTAGILFTAKVRLK